MTRDEVAALERKYVAIERLRGLRARTGELAPRATLRALAAEFPGVLRELHKLPPEEVARRRAALARARRTGRIEPWMEWLARFHAVLRAALAVKRGEARADEALAGAERRDGRLDRLAARIVAEEQGVTAAQVLALLVGPGGDHA